MARGKTGEAVGGLFTGSLACHNRQLGSSAAASGCEISLF